MTSRLNHDIKRLCMMNTSLHTKHIFLFLIHIFKMMNLTIWLRKFINSVLYLNLFDIQCLFYLADIFKVSDNWYRKCIQWVVKSVFRKHDGSNSPLFPFVIIMQYHDKDMIYQGNLFYRVSLNIFSLSLLKYIPWQLHKSIIIT